MQFTKKLFQFLLNNQVLVALPVAFYTLASFKLFNTPTQVAVPIFVYLATYALYNFHRLYGVFMGEPSDYEPRHWYTVFHFETQITLTFTALVLAIVIAATFSFATQVLLLLASIISLLYSVKFQFKNFRIRIRDIAFIKVFVIAAVVAGISVFIPFLEGPQTLHSNLIWWYYLEHFLFIVSITIPFDARDIDLDSKHNLHTIPAYFGKAKSALFATTFFMGFCCLFILLNTFSIQIFFFQLLILVSILFGILRKPSDWYYTIVIEGAMFVYYILIQSI